MQGLRTKEIPLFPSISVPFPISLMVSWAAITKTKLHLPALDSSGQRGHGQVSKWELAPIVRDDPAVLKILMSNPLHCK